ncbi:unnamed protein product, partial [Mesorhabditis spiculigera]
MRLMDRMDRLDMDDFKFPADPEMDAFFENAFQNSPRRMSGTRVVPVHLLGSNSNLSAPRDGRASVSPSPSRKFDSLPRQMPSHQFHQQHHNIPTQSQQQQQHHNLHRPPTPQRQPSPQPQPVQIEKPIIEKPYTPPPPQPVPDQPKTVKAERAPMQRKISVEDFNEQLVNMLDDVERRVEQFRETAAQLEAEKETILDMLQNVNLKTELLKLGEGEREDIEAITNRLKARTRTVDILVNTPRNSEQAKALESVNSLIDSVMGKLEQDLSDGAETCRRYLNACSPDQPEGPIDQRFQAQIIECTADDQKKIRRKLAQLIQQIERAERSCFPKD